MRKILFLLFMLLSCPLMAQKNLETGKYHYNEAYKTIATRIPQQWEWESAMREFRLALPYLQSAAKEGYGEACYLCGNMYGKGWGVNKDYNIAIRMYERAIEFGHNQGEVELGDIYFYAYDNPKKAYDYYSSGYKKGVYEAGCRIAMYSYYRNLIAAIEGTFDQQKAFGLIREHFNEAAYSLDPNVLNLAAKFCCFLHETEQDVKEFEKADEIACELMYKASKHYDVVKLMWEYQIPIFRCRYLNYNRFYIYEIVTQGDAYTTKYTDLQKGEMFYIYAMFAHQYNDMDYKWNWGYTAAEAMEKAATYGYAPAQKMIGDWYTNGIHTAKNMLKAKEWYEKAKANGMEIP